MFFVKQISTTRKVVKAPTKQNILVCCSFTDCYEKKIKCHLRPLIYFILSDVVGVSNNPLPHEVKLNNPYDKKHLSVQQV